MVRNQLLHTSSKTKHQQQRNRPAGLLVSFAITTTRTTRAVGQCIPYVWGSTGGRRSERNQLWPPLTKVPLVPLVPLPLVPLVLLVPFPLVPFPWVVCRYTILLNQAGAEVANKQ